MGLPFLSVRGFTLTALTPARMTVVGFCFAGLREVLETGACGRLWAEERGEGETAAAAAHEERDGCAVALEEEEEGREKTLFSFSRSGIASAAF